MRRNKGRQSPLVTAPNGATDRLKGSSTVSRRAVDLSMVGLLGSEQAKESTASSGKERKEDSQSGIAAAARSIPGHIKKRKAKATDTLKKEIFKVPRGSKTGGERKEFKVHKSDAWPSVRAINSPSGPSR